MTQALARKREPQKSQTMSYFTTRLLYRHNTKSNSEDYELEKFIITYPPSIF
jgi:hypothetical protein